MKMKTFTRFSFFLILFIRFIFSVFHLRFIRHGFRRLLSSLFHFQFAKNDETCRALIFVWGDWTMMNLQSSIICVNNGNKLIFLKILNNHTISRSYFVIQYTKFEWKFVKKYKYENNPNGRNCVVVPWNILQT